MQVAEAVLCVVQAGLAAASSVAWCFLNGLVAVPAEVLRQVAPVLLVRLLHHLSPEGAPPDGSAPAATPDTAHSVSQVIARMHNLHMSEHLTCVVVMLRASNYLSYADIEFRYVGSWFESAFCARVLCWVSKSGFLQGGACQTAQDTRPALVLLLIARCNMEQTALQQAGGEALFAELLRDGDARVRYHASMFVQQRLVATKADQYRRALRQLTQQAQQSNDEKLLRNPYLQISTMLQMRLIDLTV